MKYVYIGRYKWTYVRIEKQSLNARASSELNRQAGGGSRNIDKYCSYYIKYRFDDWIRADQIEKDTNKVNKNDYGLKASIGLPIFTSVISCWVK